MEASEHMSAGLMMASLYPVFVVMAVLMPLLPVLVIIEIYYIATSLYISFALLKIYRELGSVRFVIYAAIIILVVIQSELAIWLFSSSAFKFQILISKAIFYLLLGTSLISLASKWGEKLKVLGLILVIGGFLVSFPSLASLLGLFLLLLGCMGASKYLSKGFGDASFK